MTSKSWWTVRPQRRSSYDLHWNYRRIFCRARSRSRVTFIHTFKFVHDKNASRRTSLSALMSSYHPILLVLQFSTKKCLRLLLESLDFISFISSNLDLIKPICPF